MDFARVEIRRLLDDPNELISESAAQCVLATALKGSQWLESEALLEKVLAKLNQGTQDTGLSLRGITLDPETVRPLIFSPDKNESELAIRSLSLIRDNDQFVYQVLTQRLRSSELPQHKAACLNSLRACRGAIDLITIADTDAICSEVKAENRNVRLAAIELLGEMPDDEQVVRSLQEHLQEAARMHQESRKSLRQRRLLLSMHAGTLVFGLMR